MRSKSRTPARIAAVLALVAAFVVLLAIVSSQGGAGDEKASGGEPTEKQAENKRPRKAVYVVKEGDTLLGIAAEMGLSVTELEELNPGLDPQRLQTGQRIKLR
jgi:LysM repeat protein